VIKLPVDLPNHHYDILIGDRLLDNPRYLSDFVGLDDAIIVSNETIAPLYIQKIKQSIKPSRCFEYLVPDGESEKSLEQFSAISTFMLQKKLDRKTILIALGGGVIGDLGGFVAACYQRGIRYVQIPTTLLAQVDSSVGGKTAINHPFGKNMIGAFHQPSLVLSDIGLLSSLPDREFFSGLSEVIKYGLVRDYDFFVWLERNMSSLVQRKTEKLVQAVKRSCENKRDVVLEDEKEKGLRATLNFGHTFGHAIEKLMGYGKWLHGEAVAVGICMAARMSKDLGNITTKELLRIESIIKKAYLPDCIPEEYDALEMLNIMKGDKKNTDKKIRLVLLESIGRAIVTQDFSHTSLMSVIENPKVT